MKVVKGKTDWKSKRNGQWVNVARNEVAKVLGWTGEAGSIEVSHGKVEGWTKVRLWQRPTGMWIIEAGGLMWVGVYDMLRVACRIPCGVTDLEVWIEYKENKHD